MFIRTMKGLLYLLLAAAPHFVSAYTEIVHTELTKEAFKRSVIADNSFFSDLDFAVNSQQLIFPNIPFPFDQDSEDKEIYRDIFKPIIQQQLSPIDLLRYGAFAEDAPGFGVVSPDSRSLRHFLNPQEVTVDGNGIRDGGGLLNFMSSPAWTLEDKGSISSGFVEQRFSYKDANQKFHDALTRPDRQVREEKMGGVLQALGHIIHHIQDMAQPQHSRIDDHCDDACKNLALFGLHNPSEYEKYTDEQWLAKRLDQSKDSSFLSAADGLPKIDLSGYPNVDLPMARDYWLNANLSGMADFSSSNYVTHRKTFEYITDILPPSPISVGNIFPTNDDLPLPNNSALRMGAISAQVVIPNSSLVGNMLYINHDAFDNYIQEVVEIIKVTRLSVFDTYLFERSRPVGTVGTLVSKGVFAVDDEVFEERYKILLPRAVGYSAGLIDHFFKAKIDVTEIATGDASPSQWRITNVSGVPIIGQISFYSDTLSGTRNLLGSIYSVNLVNNGSTILPGFSYPTSANDKFIAVYRGSVGAETDGVAGKVFSYSEPELPACEPIYARSFSNDSGTLKQVNFTINSTERSQKFYLSTAGVGECKIIPFFNPFCTDPNLCNIVMWDNYYCPKSQWEITKNGSLISSGISGSGKAIPLSTGSYKFSIMIEDDYDSPWRWGACLSACSSGETGAPCFKDSSLKPYSIEYTASVGSGGTLTCGGRPVMINQQSIGDAVDGSANGTMLLNRGQVYAVSGGCECFPTSSISPCNEWNESLRIREAATGSVVFEHYFFNGPLEKPFYIP